MSYLSFFQLFNDFFLKNGAKFDTFSLIFEIQPPLLIRFSDAEIPIVYCRDYGVLDIFTVLYVCMCPENC